MYVPPTHTGRLCAEPQSTGSVSSSRLWGLISSTAAQEPRPRYIAGASGVREVDLVVRLPMLFPLAAA